MTDTDKLWRGKAILTREQCHGAKLRPEITRNGAIMKNRLYCLRDRRPYKRFDIDCFNAIYILQSPILQPHRSKILGKEISAAYEPYIETECKYKRLSTGFLKLINARLSTECSHRHGQ